MPNANIEIVRKLLNHMTIDEAFNLARRQISEDPDLEVSELQAEILASELVGALRRFALDTQPE